MNVALVKREKINPLLELWMPVIALFLSLFVGIFILLLFGSSPFEAYKTLFSGTFSTRFGFSQTLLKMIPLAMCAIGISIALKGNFWNIGTEGQMLLGVYGASFIALKFAGNVNEGLHIPLMMCAAAVCGSLWAFVPAALKAYFGVNEIVSTLMMNYVADALIEFHVYGQWKGPDNFPYSVPFSDSCSLPFYMNLVHQGIFYLIIISGLYYLFDRHSLLGFEMKIAGGSSKAAEYAGINAKKLVIVSMALSGAIAGIAGMIEVSGVQHRLQMGISSGYGYNGIIVSFLAKKNIWGILLVSFLFGMLIVGGSEMAIVTGVPCSLIQVFIGLIFLFVLCGQVLTRYKPIIK